ncbi:MAG TPA: hypothetical protein PKZ07_20145 [Sedimentisphaerales bacterium]|nr:hypothetical protein [Sedimentisphaerales bacterium]
MDCIYDRTDNTCTIHEFVRVSDFGASVSRNIIYRMIRNGTFPYEHLVIPTNKNKNRKTYLVILRTEQEIHRLRYLRSLRQARHLRSTNRKQRKIKITIAASDPLHEVYDNPKVKQGLRIYLSEKYRNLELDGQSDDLPDGDRQQRYVVLPEEAYRYVQIMAKKCGTTMAQALRQAYGEYLLERYLPGSKLCFNGGMMEDDVTGANKRTKNRYQQDDEPLHRTAYPQCQGSPLEEQR